MTQILTPRGVQGSQWAAFRVLRFGDPQLGETNGLGRGFVVDNVAHLLATECLGIDRQTTTACHEVLANVADRERKPSITDCIG